MPVKAKPLSERLWRSVDKNGPVMSGMDSQCWVWTLKSKTSAGYGLIGAQGGRRGGVIRTHRASWEVTHGTIPNGLWVLHKCDNPPCVRPEHLFLGDRKANVDDMMAKGRAARNCGEKNPRHKLTDAQREEVRALHAEGIGYRRLSRKFGLSKRSIAYIVTGKGGYADQKKSRMKRMEKTNG